MTQPKISELEVQECLAWPRLVTQFGTDLIKGPKECHDELTLLRVFSTKMGISYIDGQKLLRSKGLLDNSGPWTILSHLESVIVFHHKESHSFPYPETSQILLTREEIRLINKDN